MKERDELTPENRQPATEETKNEFLKLIDLLTERGYIDHRGSRSKEYKLKDGRSVHLFYNSRSAMKDLEEVTDNPTQAQVNLMQTISDYRMRMTVYYLRRRGQLEQHTGIRDLKKEQQQAKEMLERLNSGEDFQEETLKRLAELEEKIDSMNQAVELGLAFVSEADLRTVNGILQSLPKQ